MPYTKNVAANIPFGLANASTGAPLSGATVSPFVSIDNGAQASGAGTITSLGNGAYNYAATQAEMNGSVINFSFVATGAVAAFVGVKTTVANFDTIFPTVAPGAANGFLIAGTNAPVTITGSGNALTLTSTGANGSGLAASGNGTGAGVLGTGGATGVGGQFLGGITSGDGMQAIAQTSGHGFTMTANAAATRYGLNATAAGGGNNGAGARFYGNGTGPGILSMNDTAGPGMSITSTASNALSCVSSGGNSAGINAVGAGSGAGIFGTGGAVNGAGIKGLGGSTSGDGIAAVAATLGNGFVGTGAGSSKHGAIFTGGTAGTSDGFKCVAGTGGVDIRGAITGNITGNLSGSVGSLTTNNDKTGYSLTQTFPTNFSSLVIDANGRVDVSKFNGSAIVQQTMPTNFAAFALDVSGKVTVGTNSDKTGYALTSGEHTNIATDAQTGLTAQGFTTTRAPKLDNLDVAVSSVGGGGGGLDAAGVRAAIGMAAANLDTQLAGIDTHVLSRMATFTYTTPLDAAGTRSALGLAGANLDVQLATIDADVMTRGTSNYAGGAVASVTAPVVVGTNQDKTGYSATVSDKTGYVLAANGLDAVLVEAGVNLRQASCINSAVLAAIVSGMDTNNPVFKGLNSNVTRLTAVTDANGNRISVTPNLPP